MILSLHHLTPRRRATAAAGLAASVLAACGTVSHSEANSAAGDGYPVEIENCGRSLTVTSAPERVVSLYPGQTEVLLRLGLGDRVVGQAQDAVSDPDPELADDIAGIESLSPQTPPTKEVLLQAEPDLVYSGTEFEFNTEMGFAGFSELEKAGATAYVANAGCLAGRADGTVEQLFTDLAELGQIFGVEGRAAELADEARKRLDQVADRVTQPPVPTALVYYEAGTLSAIGAGIDADVLRLAGGENVFSPDESRFSDFFAAEVNPEVVSSRDPEAFVFAVTDDRHERETIGYLKRTFPTSPAVRDGRLVPVRNTVFSPGTLATIEGVETIAERLHPGT